MTNLNKDQIIAISEIRKFLASDQQMATLTGYAGTGKSFALAQFLRQALALQRLGAGAPPKTIITAPTHKAVAVVSAMLGQDFPDVESATLQAALGLYLTSDGEYKTLVSSGRSSVHNYDLLVVDEASMINTQLLEEIEKGISLTAFGRSKGTKVLFMGDILQLPPPKGTVSKVFDYTIARLTEQMRQEAGNPVETAIAWAREQAATGQPCPQQLETTLNDAGNGLHVCPGGAFQLKVLEMFQEYGSHACKLIAWTNAEVDKWNDLIRASLYPDAPEVFVGEYVNVMQPVTSQTDRGRFVESKMIFHSDQEIIIEEIRDVDLKSTEDSYFNRLLEKLPAMLRVPDLQLFHLLGVSEETSSRAWFLSLKEESQEDFKKFMRELYKLAKASELPWRTYWDIHGRFIPIRRTFATTTHKAQGSSYDNVAVVLTNLLGNRQKSDLARLVYVAFSRARKNLVVNTRRMWSSRAA